MVKKGREKVLFRGFLDGDRRGHLQVGDKTGGKGFVSWKIRDWEDRVF